MRDFFLAELQRFRQWALAAALLHAAVLAFFGRMVDPLQQPQFVYEVVGAVYALAGLLLGVYQMGGYRRPNTWLNLLHRPVSSPRIALALTGAGVLLLALAIALPVALLVLGQAGLTARVVDLRHAGLPVAAGLVAAIAYLAGAAAMLAPRRYAALLLVPMLLPFASRAPGVAALLVQAGTVAWAAALLAGAFKPDLGAPPRRAWAEAAATLPVMLGLYLALGLLPMLYQLGWMLQGSHPLNSTPPAGGYIEAARADGADLLVAGLAGSGHAEAPLWRDQVRLSEVHGTGAPIAGFPIRHQLTNPVPLEFDDEANRLRWIFSHDEMAFLGVDLASRRRAGRLGPDGAEGRFEDVPLAIGAGWIAGPRHLYAYDEHTRRLDLRIELPAGETLAAAPGAAGESVVLLSDRVLRFYDARALRNGEGRLAPRQALPLPGAVGSLDRVDLIELLDGYLVSFTFGRDSVDGRGAAWQETWRLGGEGGAERVARRALAPDFPAALRHATWWLSPAMYSLRRALAGLGAPDASLARRDLEPMPRGIQGLALGLMALCALLAAGLSRRQGLAGAHRAAWILACAAAGLPALLAMRLMHPDHAQPEFARLPDASPRPA